MLAYFICAAGYAAVAHNEDVSGDLGAPQINALGLLSAGDCQFHFAALSSEGAVGYSILISAPQIPVPPSAALLLKRLFGLGALRLLMSAGSNPLAPRRGPPYTHDT